MNEAYRITVEYSADKCEKSSVQRLQMRIPGGKNRMDKRRENGIGQYIEVFGPKNKLLYRRNLGTVISKTVGVPTGDSKKPYAQVPLGKLKMIASILVPVFEGAEKIVLMEAAPSSKKAGKEKIAAIENHELVEVKLLHGKENK